ncbi:MAG TPA: hypothetical protein VFP97_17790 [Chitinophagaceae bacterium]|nr:hypothetical protein [Chitinophagaceae bacterium]
MQSENFDNKIKDSLSQRPPGNDPPEWDKMQLLLDKHLPVEKKDRRRIVFILLLFLLLGGGAYFIWKNNGGNDHDITASKLNGENSTPKNNTDNSTEKNVTTPGASVKEIPLNNSAETSSSPGPDRSSIQQPSNTIPKSNEVVLPGPEKPANVTVQKTSVKGNRNTKDARTVKPNKQPTEKPNNNSQPVTSVENNNNPGNVPAIVEKQKADATQKITDPQKPVEVKENAAEKITGEQKQTKPAESQRLTADTKTQKQPNKNSFFTNLFFSVSAGPDLSIVGFEDIGKLRPVIGAGIGYQFSEKFSLRTGFYSARKVYTADPYEYHPPYNVWTAYPNLKNIDANCKVYEIPLTIDYTISENKQRGWFVSAGISTFLMKEEIYDYHFKPNSSPTYVTYRKTITNQNKHYFSVLGLSGGYTRHINNHLSLRAEPYTKFALGGVGYGKVKLNGGGVLVTAIIKPFATK